MIKHLVLTPDAAKFKKTAQKNEAYIDKLTLKWAQDRLGGVELNTLEIHAGAGFDTEALEFVISRLRK